MPLLPVNLPGNFLASRHYRTARSERRCRRPESMCGCLAAPSAAGQRGASGDTSAVMDRHSAGLQRRAPLAATRRRPVASPATPERRRRPCVPPLRDTDVTERHVTCCDVRGARSVPPAPWRCQRALLAADRAGVGLTSAPGASQRAALPSELQMACGASGTGSSGWSRQTRER